jgi:hypothetical protein
MQQALEFFRKVHPVVQWGCAGLLGAFLWMYASLIWQKIKAGRQIKRFIDGIGPGQPEGSSDERQGLHLKQLEEMRVRLRRLEGSPAEWWRRIERHVESYTSPMEHEGWFITEQPREVLPYDVLVGREFNIAKFSSFPGILTGAGLTLTFVAILIALYGVRINEGNATEPVTGMKELIEGLSGKFLSSIVALILSIIFTLTEKMIVRNLRLGYESLIATVSDAIPYLSPARILIDIQRFSAKQTVSISHISSEVVDRLVGAFNSDVVPALAEGMSSGVADKMQSEFRPTMQKMGDTLENLKTAIVSLESQKQDSVTGEIRALMQSLESSLVQALTRMGEDFHNALTGAASREFGNVQGTLEATRQILSEMNTQFSEQLKTGREQTEGLTALMSGLMVRLQESADQNLSNVRTQLTLVVSDLSEKVGSLSKELMTAAESVTRQSQASANSILEKTGEWSEATAKRLESLVASIEARSKEFQEAGRTLLDANKFLKDTISQNAAALDRMAEASRQVQSYSSALAGQSEAMKAVTQLQASVSAQLRDSTGGLQAVSAESGRILAIYRQNFESYKAVIDELDANLAKILAALHSGLRDYNQSIENNFREVVKISNQMVPEISNLLQNQVEELGGQLEELGTVISRAMEQVNGRVK